MANAEHISWDLFDQEARGLAETLRNEGPWKGVIAVARGGFAAATIIANVLIIHELHSVLIKSYKGQEQSDAQMLSSVDQISDGEGWLFVDDLVDTGETAKLIKDRYPKAKLAVVYTKPKGAEYADFSVREVAQDCWLHFPWDGEEG